MRVLLLCDQDAASLLRASIGRTIDVTSTFDRIGPEGLSAVDLVISYGYRYIIPSSLLSHCRFINLHISLLPFNRGADPNVWSILEGTPKGVSIHVIDSGIDTGPILAQREVTFDERRHTLRSSYSLLHDQIRGLFGENLEALLEDRITPKPQTGIGTFHLARHFSSLRNALLGEEGWDVPLPLFRSRFDQLRNAKRNPH